MLLATVMYHDHGNHKVLRQHNVVAVQICKAAFEEQLLLITAGLRATIRFLPPLTISSAEMDEALQKLERAFARVFDVHSSAPREGDPAGAPATPSRVIDKNSA
jgi:acetylornithine/succinyldiaminopimelate/putrescine aminotransferase